MPYIPASYRFIFFLLPIATVSAAFYSSTLLKIPYWDAFFIFFPMAIYWVLIFGTRLILNTQHLRLPIGNFGPFWLWMTVCWTRMEEFFIWIAISRQPRSILDYHNEPMTLPVPFDVWYTGFWVVTFPILVFGGFATFCGLRYLLKFKDI